jgi:hypothetical protein
MERRSLAAPYAGKSGGADKVHNHGVRFTESVKRFSREAVKNRAFTGGAGR